MQCFAVSTNRVTNITETNKFQFAKLNIKSIKWNLILKSDFCVFSENLLYFCEGWYIISNEINTGELVFAG